MSKEIIKSIHEAEDRITATKRLMKESVFLNSIENKHDFALDFSPKCILTLTVKNDYPTLIHAIKALRAEGIKCEFVKHFNLSDIDMFTYTDGVMEISFWCRKGNIPEQLMELRVVKQ